MIVPWLVLALPDLHETHAAFEQAPRYERLPPVYRFAVHLSNMFRLFAYVERVGRFGLHAERKFVRLNLRFDQRVFLSLFLVALVQGGEQIKLFALLLARGGIVLDVLNQALDFGLFGVNVSALIDRRQKTGRPVLRAADRVAVRTEHDESRQVLIFRAQAISQPRAKARTDLPQIAAIHHQQRRLVIRQIRAHRTYDAQIVHAPGDIGIEFADFDAALSVPLKLIWRTKADSGFTFGLEMNRQWLAVIFREHRLRIEGVHLRRTAVHKQVDDAFDLRCEMRRLGGQRVGKAVVLGAGGLLEELNKGERSKAHATSVEQLTTCQKTIFRIYLM